MIEKILNREIENLRGQISAASAVTLTAQPDSWFEGYSIGRESGLRAGLDTLLGLQAEIHQAANDRAELIDSLMSRLEICIKQRCSESSPMSPDYWIGQIDTLVATLRLMGEHVDHPDF